MKKRNSYLWLILFLAASMVFQFLRNEDAIENDSAVLVKLQDSELSLTKHAKCRMSCREINLAEIKDILKNGKVNWKKSDENDQPCPSYALEGWTKDGQNVRIIFADCNRDTRVITVIDLKNEYPCSCR